MKKLLFVVVLACIAAPASAHWKWPQHAPAVVASAALPLLSNSHVSDGCGVNVYASCGYSGINQYANDGGNGGAGAGANAGASAGAGAGSGSAGSGSAGASK